MTTLLVTRHAGARDWATQNGFDDVETLANLGTERIAALGPGDTVIGTLPVNVVAEVNARGARYFHLVMSTPPDRRGQELTADEMAAHGAHLEEYTARKIGDI